METLKMIGQVVVVVLIVGAVLATMAHRWQSKFTSANLARVFFWFGLVCAAMAIFTQYSAVYQVGTPNLFGDAGFFLPLGMLSMLGGILLNTEKRM